MAYEFWKGQYGICAGAEVGITSEKLYIMKQWIVRIYFMIK